jgi:hypothetical protein
LTDPEEVEIDPAYRGKSSELYEKYSMWARRNYLPVMCNKSFKKEMARRGHAYSRTNSMRSFSGVRPADIFDRNRNGVTTHTAVPVPVSVSTPTYSAAPAPTSPPTPEPDPKVVAQLTAEIMGGKGRDEVIANWRAQNESVRP